MSQAPAFSEAQALYLEDRVLNKITPAHMALELLIRGRGVSDRQLEASLASLHELTAIIRGLRGVNESLTPAPCPQGEGINTEGETCRQV